MSTPSERPVDLTLNQLLQRNDIWRGNYNQVNSGAAVNTGYDNLNALLLHNGWPLGGLIESCQQQYQGEWQLFLPALQTLAGGLIVLLNPPAQPFSQALIQAGVNLDQLIVVNVSDKAQFLSCFRELARTARCSAILGWQTRDHYTYTELRKCLLAASDGKGLYTLFRPAPVQQQSSPAQLRLYCKAIPAGLEVTVFKQKGVLQNHQSKPVVLPFPSNWQAALPYAELDQSAQSGARQFGKAPVFNLRGNP